jgi:hypothetical protein
MIGNFGEKSNRESNLPILGNRNFDYLIHKVHRSRVCLVKQDKYRLILLVEIYFIVESIKVQCVHALKMHDIL